MYAQKQSGVSPQSLGKLLESDDDKVHTRARKALVVIGKQAVPSLSLVLGNSKMIKDRWEAAKALGEIVDRKSIPTITICWITFGRHSKRGLFPKVFHRPHTIYWRG